jgi:glutathione S-transferase
MESDKLVSVLLDEIERLKAGPYSVVQSHGAEIHGMPISANAVSPIVFSKHVLGDNCELKICNLMEGDQMKPEFLAMNPFHTIPTFKDSDGFSLGEGNAILRYIANKYAPQFYGNGDLKLKARIDWALDLKSMKVYDGLKDIVYPIMGFGAAPADQEKVNKQTIETLDTFANLFLKDQKFIAGNSPCIADFGLVPMIVALGHSVVKAKTEFDLPAIWHQYIEDFSAAVPSAALYSNAGGFSINEFLSSKA